MAISFPAIQNSHAGSVTAMLRMIFDRGYGGAGKSFDCIYLPLHNIWARECLIFSNELRFFEFLFLQAIGCRCVHIDSPFTNRTNNRQKRNYFSDVVEIILKKHRPVLLPRRCLHEIPSRKRKRHITYSSSSSCAFCR